MLQGHHFKAKVEDFRKSILGNQKWNSARIHVLEPRHVCMEHFSRRHFEIFLLTQNKFDTNCLLIFFYQVSDHISLEK